MTGNGDEAVVRALWRALSRKDWDALQALLCEQSFYEDVATPDAGATGPQAIVRRLRIAFDHIARHEHEIHRLVAGGGSVLLEHTEVWHFAKGERASNRFVTVHELRNGKVLLWRDYWDVQSFTAQFPAWFLQKLAEHAAAVGTPPLPQP